MLFEEFQIDNNTFITQGAGLEDSIRNRIFEHQATNNNVKEDALGTCK
jgi:hypothetical protein